ncbi:MAG TPA: hypothetical protein VKR79_06025 [Gaiellaceae bacterium]|nr:hypothetical protein [Gaiellaceae bacterium]
MIGLYAWKLTYEAGSPAYDLPVTMVNGHPVVDLKIQTVAAIGPNLSQNPDWVSYLVRTKGGVWKRETVWDLPANATIHVTDYNFDGDSGLRNPLYGKMVGVSAGGTQNAVFLNGKVVSEIDPATASHVFAVPSLGIDVAFQGVADDAKNQCGPQAPCPMSNAHSTTTFTFHTSTPGHFRWQCFVPCAAGWIDGWGGPMQTIGYMDGFINVKA